MLADKDIDRSRQERHVDMPSGVRRSPLSLRAEHVASTSEGGPPAPAARGHEPGDALRELRELRE